MTDNIAAKQATEEGNGVLTKETWQHLRQKINEYLDSHSEDDDLMGHVCSVAERCTPPVPDCLALEVLEEVLSERHDGPPKEMHVSTEACRAP